MKLTRIAAMIAVPAAMLLSACAGGSSGIVGGGGGGLGQQANVRFVHGSPTTGNVDIYFQSNGSAAPTSSLLAAVPYAVPSTYVTLPNVAGSVIVKSAGSPPPSVSATGVLASCPVPQFQNNQNYSIVVATAAGTLNCILFQDGLYTASNQFRFHNASASEAATVAFGATTAPGVPGTSTFAVLGTAVFGQPAVTGSGSATSFTLSSPATLGTPSNVSFAVGAAGPGIGAIDTATNTVDASFVTLPGTTTQPNAGNNNYTLPSGYAGVGIYDIACGAAALPTGSHCVGGNALIGVFDTH